MVRTVLDPRTSNEKPYTRMLIGQQHQFGDKDILRELQIISVTSCQPLLSYEVIHQVRVTEPVKIKAEGSHLHLKITSTWKSRSWINVRSSISYSPLPNIVTADRICIIRMYKTMNCDRTQGVDDIAAAFKIIMRSIGEDPDREGLLQTPQRFAHTVLDLTRGYHMSPKLTINDAKFDLDYSAEALPHEVELDCHDIVLVKDIDISSLCEHHFLPFVGKAYIGYLPNNRVLGISKLARILEIYARRLQIQERLTRQVAHTVQNELEPHGVIVMIKCSHMCMSIRGTQQTDATTVTQYATGVFQTDPRALDQFHNLLRS